VFDGRLRHEHGVESFIPEEWKSVPVVVLLLCCWPSDVQFTEVQADRREQLGWGWVGWLIFHVFSAAWCFIAQIAGGTEARFPQVPKRMRKAFHRTHLLWARAVLILSGATTQG